MGKMWHGEQTASLWLLTACVVQYRSSAPVQQPSARFISIRPCVSQPRQRCGPASFRPNSQGCRPQYGAPTPPQWGDHMVHMEHMVHMVSGEGEGDGGQMG
jgi:hypothetical protein